MKKFRVTVRFKPKSINVMASTHAEAKKKAYAMLVNEPNIMSIIDKKKTGAHDYEN